MKGAVVRGVLAFGAAAAALVACQAFVTLAVDAPADASVADGVAPPTFDAALDPCAARAPPPPAAGSSGASGPTLLFAAYKWAVERTVDPELCPPPAGFDLDGLDTGPPGVCTANAACRKLDDSTALIDNCDEPGGVDNNAMRALAYLRNLPNGIGAFDELDTMVSLRRGVSNMLLELVDYDGDDDDDDVTVHFYGSAGMSGVPNAAGFGFEQLRSLPEIWDGGQDAAWVVSEPSVTVGDGGALPRYSARGYVRRAVLVVPDVPIAFGPPSMFATNTDALSHSVMTAELVRDDATYKLLRGRIGASVKSSALLAALATIRYGNGGFLCASDQYAIARAVACSALDLPPADSAPDAAMSCGAMSLSFSFASVASRFARDDAGALAVGVGYGSARLRPCADDDAGTVFCDDCAWPQPRQCASDARDH